MTGVETGTARPRVPLFEVGMVLYPAFTLLDLAGPEAVLRPHGRIHLLSKTLRSVRSDGGVEIGPTTLLSDCPSELDVLFVPGGLGTHAAMADRDFVDFIGRAGRSARYVTSVCTGSLLLAKAGLLDGYRAATHWALHDELAATAAHATRDRVVKDRNRITGGGVTAGLDFGLALLAELRGEYAAKLSQLMLQYDPSPPFEAGAPETAGPELTSRALAAFRDAVQAVNTATGPA